MLTQKLDPADQVLAFTIGWVEALAARLDRLDVLCLEQRTSALPSNVRVWSMGKERSVGRPAELVNFYRALGQLIRKVDVIFCHMIPRYAVLAAPLAALHHKPMVLWYVHRQISPELRLALAACKFIATAVPESFPLPTPRLRALGHGIDSTFYTPDPAVRRDDPPLVIHVARLMPIKHQETLIRALIPGMQATFIGDVLTGQGDDYVTRLRALVADLGLTNRVTFTGRLDRLAVRECYRRATVAVNLSPPGLFDKAALESMLISTPTVVSSTAFDPVLGEYASRLRIDGPDDVSGLSTRLRDLLAMPHREQQQMAESIRARVATAHSLPGLMDKLAALLCEAVDS